MENAQNILRNTSIRDRTPTLYGEYLQFTPQQGGYNPQPGGGYNPQYGGGVSGGEGTLRVKFIMCPTGPLSLIAKSAGPTFSSFNIAQY
jgi:hypothetical protein